MRATFAVVFLVAIVTPSSAGDVPTEAMLRAWVADLGAADFDVRERGEKNLLAAGPHAMAFVLPAVKSADAEVARRAEGIAKEAENNAAKVLEDLGGAVSRRKDGSVRGVDFRESKGNKLSDADLAQILALPTLERLNLEGTNTTDAGLPYFNRVTTLESLVLDGPRITDEGLNHLNVLKSLVNLSIRNANVQGRGLKHMGGLPKLETLQLYKCSVTDDGLVEGIQGLRQCTVLRSLFFYETKITDISIRLLAELKSLRGLGLANNSIHGAGLEHLAGLPHLGDLFLYGTDLNDNAVPGILKLKSVQRLFVGKSKVTMRGLQTLKNMPMLRELSVNDLGLQLNDVEELRKAMPKVSIHE